MVETEIHTYTGAKNGVLLANANKWEGEAIDKKENLARAIQDLNVNSRCFEVLRVAQRKMEANVEVYKRKFNDAKDKFVCEQEKKKRELDVMIKKLSLNVEIGYNLAIDSFKKDSKKKGLG